MAKKFLLGLAVCLWMLLAANARAACPSGSNQSGDYCYTQYNGKVTITNYQGSGGNVVIPDTIAGMPVVSIRKFAYQNNTSLTGVIIPDSVISIGDNAFSYCKNLTSVTLGNSVTSIGTPGNNAFTGCWNLNNILVSANNQVYSSHDGVVYNNDKTTLILCPEGKSGELILPSSVTSIAEYAFYSADITSVTLSESLISIGEYAFYHCHELTNVVIPDNVTTIGAYAFSSCWNLSGVIIGNSVSSIGYYAFISTSLTSVHIPASVTSIEHHAFATAEMTSITVDENNSVFSRQDAAVYNKDKTVLVMYPSGRSGEFTILDGVTSIGDYAVSDCALTSVTIPDSVITIGNSAFEACARLTSVRIPDSVTTLGFGAFANSGLVSVTIPDSVTSIGEHAFASSRLTNVTIGNGLTSIPNSAFQACLRLTNVTIPESVTTIESGAFGDCWSLTSVSIPDSVTSIGDRAFSWCERLSVAYFQGDAPSLESFVFDGCAPDFKICYTADATGFTTPVWEPSPYNSYPAEACACTSNSDCEDDDLYCTGAPVCDEGMCGFAISPCNGDSPVCDEGLDQCVTAHGVLDTGDPNERVCNPRSYTDLGNGIVRDNVTRLEWVQDGNLIATRNPDFDNDETEGDGGVTWQHAAEYIDLLNAEEYLGHSDWRLPTIEELSSLVDSGRYNPAIDPIFNNTVATEYWSSTPDSYNSGAWNVNFISGNVSCTVEEHGFYVRAVRAGQSMSLDNFVINGDGTVTDIATGLMWQQCTDGQIWDGYDCTGDAYGQTWDEALAYVQGLNDTDYLGYDDWRLPTRNELQSLVDYSLYMPATTFPNTGEAPYFDFTPWSSTADAYDTLGAWVLYFYDGYMGGDGKDNYHGVRAVRSGPCRSNGDWCIDNSDCADGFECTEGACEPVAVDNPPAITAGPFLAASTWPVLPTSQASPMYLDANYSVLWTFSDDYASCPSGACTHVAEYQAVGDSSWTSIDVTANAAKGFAYVTLPIESLQNATTYAFRYSVTDCASQTTQSAVYYFRVAVTDAPPVITAGPYLAAGPWPALPTSSSRAFVLDENVNVLWTFSDDYAFCSGLCTHRARYRKVGDTAWTWITVSADPTGKKYAYAELSVVGLAAGTYQFHFDVLDCAGQRTYAPKVYYFKVE